MQPHGIRFVARLSLALAYYAAGGRIECFAPFVNLYVRPSVRLSRDLREPWKLQTGWKYDKHGHELFEI